MVCDDLGLEEEGECWVGVPEVVDEWGWEELVRECPEGEWDWH